GGQPQLQVGVHRVRTLVLEPVGAELVQQADAAAFVAALVDDHSGTGLGDPRHGRVQLVAAVAAVRAERVPGEAFRVEPDQRPLPGAGVAVDQDRLLGVVHDGAVADRPRFAVAVGDPGLHDPFDEGLRAAAVGHELFDGDQGEAVLVGEGAEFRQPGHGAVVVDDLRDHPGGAAASEPGQVHGGFGVPAPHQHPAGTVAQGEDVAGPDEVAGLAGLVGEQPDRAGTVRGGDAGVHPGTGVHGHGVGGVQ